MKTAAATTAFVTFDSDLLPNGKIRNRAHTIANNLIQYDLKNGSLLLTLARDPTIGLAHYQGASSLTIQVELNQSTVVAKGHVLGDGRSNGMTAVIRLHGKVEEISPA
jgi:hypothetical protein